MTGDAPSPGQGQGSAEVPAAPLALYRRYRPASFAEVKGQDHVTEPLRQALRSGRVNHAYLFSGPRGCGKTSSARILARSLNCEQGPTPDPCGVCASCVALAPAGPGSIDVIEIDAASHGGVDDARDLRERAFYAPVSGRYKIYIIDEAHMVTREGFNALLKLVEEPPPHLKFVFATTEPEKVIATIRSRTHHYPFRLVPPAVLRDLLEEILASEAVAYEPAVLPVVIRAGGGSVRDSLSVLDQLIAGSDESGLSYARAASLLGFTDDRLLDEVVQAFGAADGAGVFGAIDRVVEAGHDPRRFAADLLDRLRDLIVLAAVPDAVSTGLLDIPADRVDGMRAQADGLGQAGLTRAAEIVSAGLIEMRGATSPRLLLELMCAQVLLPAAPGGASGAPGSAGDADLRARLDRLERRLDGLAQQGLPAPAAAGTTAADRPAVGGRVAAAQPPEPAARPQQRGAPAAAAVRSDPASGPASPGPASAASASAASASAAPASARSSEPAAALAAASPPAAPATPPTAPAAADAGHAGPVDTALLAARWPDILEAVKSGRRVAWILLASATVQSLADGVLTIEFPSEGNARGFVSSGHDAVLSQVLQDMFGITPVLRAATAAPGQGGPAGSAGPGGAGRGSAPRGPAARPGGSSHPPGQAPASRAAEQGPAGAHGAPGPAAAGQAAQGHTAQGHTAQGHAAQGQAVAGPGAPAASQAAAGQASPGLAPGHAGQGHPGQGHPGQGHPGQGHPGQGHPGHGQGQAGPGHANAAEPPPWNGPPDGDDWDDPREDEDDYGMTAGAPPVPPPPGRPGGPAGGPHAAMDLIARELGGRVIEGSGPA
jgi:DNA polymerase-3 subunit gamma/tau